MGFLVRHIISLVMFISGCLLVQAVSLLPATCADLSDACLKCHKYTMNHHPIDFTPDNSADYPFPLFDGKVKCLTCHEEHDRGGVNFLRGGPYAERRDICFKCHFREKYADINPHVMLNSQGKVLEINGKPVCLLCHTIKPDPIVARAEDVQFRADVGFLCWRCHPPMPGPLFNKHFLVKPPEQMLAYIRQIEQDKSITIPLIPRGRITCSTCHNPHQKGVILYEPSAKGADSRGKLRQPSVCLACHQI